MMLPLIFGALFLLLISLLLIPIEICLDTIGNNYYLRLRGLAKASIESDKEELLRIRLKVFFRNFYFYPLKQKGIGKTKKIEEKKVKKTKQSIGFRKFVRLLKSFTIKELFVNVDTGDYLLNAKLYPVFVFLKYHRRNFNINFEGKNQMVLYVQNRPIHIIKSFINL